MEGGGREVWADLFSPPDARGKKERKGKKEENRAKASKRAARKRSDAPNRCTALSSERLLTGPTTRARTRAGWIAFLLRFVIVRNYYFLFGLL